MLFPTIAIYFLFKSCETVLFCTAGKSGDWSFYYGMAWCELPQSWKLPEAIVSWKDRDYKKFSEGYLGIRFNAAIIVGLIQHTGVDEW